jgi:cell division protein FtsB
MRWLLALFVIVLTGLQIDLWLSDDGRPALRALREDVAEQTAVNRELAERNADLEAEVANLNQGNEAAEERARSELGMLQPDETFYQIIEPD